MFAGIYRVGAGLGPAAAFLYSGPALNILAIFLTARVLGFQLGLWRAVGAILFGIILGVVMAFPLACAANHNRLRSALPLPFAAWNDRHQSPNDPVGPGNTTGETTPSFDTLATPNR